MQHAPYIRALTICACPVTKIDNPGTPRMCEYCDLLHRVICKSPTNDCPACTIPNTDANNLSTCPICVLYALVHQNKFSQRWNDIQTAVPTTRRAQINASLNSPQRMAQSTPPGSDLTTDTSTTHSSTHMYVNLTFPRPRSSRYVKS